MYASAMVLKTDRPIPQMEELTRKTLAEINPKLSVVRFQTLMSRLRGCSVRIDCLRG